ncbi:hypothetical protein SAMN05216533_8355 [Streptomyces sp. Ag109_O5-10]|nr:hypothetical protein SAMN05216533_8355 [Streptomyces sp. Ag109_O5-10]
MNVSGAYTSPPLPDARRAGAAPSRRTGTVRRVDGDVELDADGWESRHRAVYGCGAWERACRQGGLMTAWHQEQDPLFGASASRRHGADPGARVKWPWGSGPHTLGLLLWRTAYDAGILVDEVPLADVLRHCDPAAPPPAAGGPMPAAARDGGIGAGGVEAVARVRPVLLAHLTPELPRTARAGARPAATVGYRVREILATPDWDHGDWPAVIALARQAMRRADVLREQGTWRPGARERSLYGRVSLDREPAAVTGARGGRAPGWLARATHLVGLADVLTGAVEALPRDDGGTPEPLVQALQATARACAGLRTSSEEVRQLWAAEPQEPRDAADWELSHVPETLRVQTEETRELVRTLSAFLWTLACA